MTIKKINDHNVELIFSYEEVKQLQITPSDIMSNDFFIFVLKILSSKISFNVNSDAVFVKSIFNSKKELIMNINTEDPLGLFMDDDTDNDLVEDEIIEFSLKELDCLTETYDNLPDIDEENIVYNTQKSTAQKRNNKLLAYIFSNSIELKNCLEIAQDKIKGKSSLYKMNGNYILLLKAKTISEFNKELIISIFDEFGIELWKNKDQFIKDLFMEPYLMEHGKKIIENQAVKKIIKYY